MAAHDGQGGARRRAPAPTRGGRGGGWLGLLAGGLLAGAALSPAPVRAAPRGSAVKVDQGAQVLRLNREAMELYDALEFDVAIQLLESALRVAEKAGLATHAVAARTYANLGLVWYVGLREEEKALDAFKKALTIAPTYKLPKEVAPPPAQELFARARRELRGEPATAGGRDKEDLAGAPAEASAGGAGLALAARTESAPPAAAEEVVRSPREARAAREDDENPLVMEASARAAPAGPPTNRLFVGLAVGSGAGYARGDGVEAYRRYSRGFSPGFAAQGLGHVSPEIGYFLTRAFAVALQTRHQVIPRSDPYTARGAHAALLRGLLFGGEGAGRFYGAFGVGGGEGFRLVVNAQATDGRTIKDTVKGGPLVASAGGGFAYALTDRFVWMVETNLLAGVPTFSMTVDVNTGLRASF